MRIYGQYRKDRYINQKKTDKDDEKMNQQNYQKLLEKCIEKHDRAGETPTLLLHSCCAPCSSYCLEYLSQYFRITVFYYNPNLYPQEEYKKRAAEQKRFIRELTTEHKVEFAEGIFDAGKFVSMAKGLEQEPEGGERCFACYKLRLEEAAKTASEGGFDYFTTTLSISPLKNAQKLNEIGKELSEKYGVSYLYSDFKKRGGYQRSIELSKQYHLYRQDYCGCVFSFQERQKQKEDVVNSIVKK